MMNYKFIINEKILDEFITWLPELRDNEVYYVALFARSKYDSSVLNNDTQIKRFTTTKKHLKEKIKQLECIFGAYTSNNNPISNDAFALYITVNPRDLYKATKESIKTLVDIGMGNQKVHYDPHKVVLSAIQKSKAHTYYMDFDFDNVKLDDIIKNITFNLSAIKILQTRGGFHILVNPEKIESQFKNTWYKNISSINGCDCKGDNLIPIAGCSQGGFMPKFIENIE